MTKQVEDKLIELGCWNFTPVNKYSFEFETDYGWGKFFGDSLYGAVVLYDDNPDTYIHQVILNQELKKLYTNV